MRKKSARSAINFGLIHTPFTCKSFARLLPRHCPTCPKSPTGIEGLDEITEGGLPLGRPTLICGSAGCGKTLLGIEFLVRGILDYNEPGVLMAFEETARGAGRQRGVAGFDLAELQASKMLRVDHVHVDRSEIEETGEYDLEGLVYSPGPRHRLHWGQARGAGHD